MRQIVFNITRTSPVASQARVQASFLSSLHKSYESSLILTYWALNSMLHLLVRDKPDFLFSLLILIYWIVFTLFRGRV